MRADAREVVAQRLGARVQQRAQPRPAFGEELLVEASDLKLGRGVAVHGFERGDLRAELGDLFGLLRGDGRDVARRQQAREQERTGRRPRACEPAAGPGGVFDKGGLEHVRLSEMWCG
ncbi:MAG: hypothetical protein LC800_22450 [Acidobacteria bacterium]|nr:hypothetical protein [Acidobacteriota bacterium]